MVVGVPYKLVKKPFVGEISPEADVSGTLGVISGTETFGVVCGCAVVPLSVFAEVSGDVGAAVALTVGATDGV